MKLTDEQVDAALVAMARYTRLPYGTPGSGCVALVPTEEAAAIENRAFARTVVGAALEAAPKQPVQCVEIRSRSDGKKTQQQFDELRVWGERKTMEGRMPKLVVDESVGDVILCFDNPPDTPEVRMNGRNRRRLDYWLVACASMVGVLRWPD